MGRFGGVGARLSVALLLVVTTALLIVYVAVVPSLEQRIADERLARVERTSQRLTVVFLEGVPYVRWQDFVTEADERTGFRVVLLAFLDRSPLSLTPQADSRLFSSSVDVSNDAIALEAVERGRAHGVVRREGVRYAEVARLLGPNGPVLLVSSSIEGSLANVDLVERRLVAAGLIALLVALAIGYGGARLHTRRIRRLEQAANRIARGELDEPVADPQQDELGELARAFEDMRRRLAQLEHARREFVANASHELRTPLFSLGGHLELLADEELDSRTRSEFVATMREQVDRLTRLASDLLDLSRLDAGRLHVERRPVDLEGVARSLVHEFRPLADSREHALELAANGAAEALGDEQRITQIGRILLENALLHTPPGTRVRVSTSIDDGRAMLSVEDDGPGVTEEHRDQIFERFYRAGANRSSGSGLGLAIARELAVVMGGSIALEDGGGTRFTASFESSPTPVDRRGPSRENGKRDGS